MQLGEPRLPAEGPLQHLGAEARASHAEQQHVREARAPRGFGDCASNRSRCASWPLVMPEPAEPLRLVAAGPQRRVARPEPPHLPAAPAIRPATPSLPSELGWAAMRSKRRWIARGAGPAALRLDGRQQLAERVRRTAARPRSSSASVGRFHRDAGLGERAHRVARGLDVLGEARARPPVIAERGRASAAGSC